MGTSRSRGTVTAPGNVFVLLLALLAMPAGAEPEAASGADFFAGLVVGEPLSDSELETFYGKGFTIDLSGAVNNGSIAQPISSTVTGGAFGGAEGIMQVTQFTGDSNTVSVNVFLEVNINTTTITNSTGLNTTVTNGFSLSSGSAGISVTAP